MTTQDPEDPEAAGPAASASATDNGEEPLTRAEAENLVAESMSWVVPLRRDDKGRPQLDASEWAAREHPGRGWAFLPTRPDRVLGVVVSRSRRVEWFVTTDSTPESAFARTARLDAIDRDPPYSPAHVREWLTDLTSGPRHERSGDPDSADKSTSDDLVLLRDALLATLEALGKDNLFSWGPAPGSRAEGEYERAHQTFYALERPLRQRMRADGVER